MRQNINQHEGKKYLKKVYSANESGVWADVDVYEVLDSFEVTCPAIQHAIKKLLFAGNRNKGSKLDDLKGALAAINRAIDLQERRESESTNQKGN